MIQVQDLHKQFGRLKVLNNVNLQLGKGECVALIGPNGCGKTTLIKSVLGMVIPTSGQILFNGVKVSGGFEYRRQIGYMPQIGRYPENMSIGQVIGMIRDLRQSSISVDEHLLHAFKLQSLYPKKMRTLSGGTTQKVSATLAFLFNPEVLILDEPTAGLDPIASEILKEKIISEKEKGKLIIITSHLLSELDDLVTHVVFMQDGNVKFNSEIGDLRAQTGETKISRSIAKILKEQSHG